MAVDIIKIGPESFQTLYARKENNIIMRTESGRRIVIQRIIPGEWIPYRIGDSEDTMNDNKRNIRLIDRNALSKIEKELLSKLNE